MAGAAVATKIAFYFQRDEQVDHKLRRVFELKKLGPG